MQKTWPPFSRLSHNAKPRVVTSSTRRHNVANMQIQHFCEIDRFRLALASPLSRNLKVANTVHTHTEKRNLFVLYNKNSNVY